MWGGPEGEGGIKDLRHHAPKGLKFKFAKNLLGNSHREGVTKQCQESVQIKLGSEKQSPEEIHRRHRYKLYRTIEEAVSLFQSRLPISVVEVDGRDGFGIAVKAKEVGEIVFHSFTVTGTPLVQARAFPQLALSIRGEGQNTLRHNLVGFGTVVFFTSGYWSYLAHDW
jgi:hypothetical protein